MFVNIGMPIHNSPKMMVAPNLNYLIFNEFNHLNQSIIIIIIIVFNGLLHKML